MPIREIISDVKTESELKREYNSLVKDLKQDGHEVVTYENKRHDPTWRFGRKPPYALFTARKREGESLPDYFDHASKHAIRVAKLLERVDKYYTKKKLTRPKMEHLRANLLNILHGMRTPQRIQDIDLYASTAAEHGVEIKLDHFHPHFRRELMEVGEKRKALLDSLRQFEFEDPNPRISSTVMRMVHPRTRASLD